MKSSLTSDGTPEERKRPGRIKWVGTSSSEFNTVNNYDINDEGTKGEPVPGADIFIEQEPDDEPIIDENLSHNGFKISIDWWDNRENVTAYGFITNDGGKILSISSMELRVPLKENDVNERICKCVVPLERMVKAPGNKGGFAIGGFNAA